MYGIKILFDLREDLWIWVSTYGKSIYEREPLLFDTKEEAEEHSKIWKKQGKEDRVKVEKYVRDD